MPRTDSDYKKGHVFRASAKSLLALVYATIGSASMESGKVMVKGGPGKVTNPDGTESALMPQEIWHNKIRLPGYEEFNSQEYYKLAKEKAAEVIAEGECVLASSQKELWKIDNKNGPEFLFTLQTYPEGIILPETISANRITAIGKRIELWVLVIILIAITGYRCSMIGKMNVLHGAFCTVTPILITKNWAFIPGVTTRCVTVYT